VVHHKEPWKYVILGALRHGEANLSAIYENIEKAQDEAQDDGEIFINPALSKNDPSAGNRPKYQQVVRSYISDLIEQGLVERLARGHYLITDAGKKWLKEYEG
jgi:DNA-binding PadR family transcriptional regulator